MAVMAVLAQDEDTGSSSRSGPRLVELPRCWLLEGQLRGRSLAEEYGGHWLRCRLLEGQLEEQLRCWSPVEERMEFRPHAESRMVSGGARWTLWLATVALGETEQLSLRSLSPSEIEEMLVNGSALCQ